MKGGICYWPQRHHTGRDNKNGGKSLLTQAKGNMLAVTLLLSLLFSLFAVWVKPKNEKSGVYRMLLEEEGVR